MATPTTSTARTAARIHHQPPTAEVILDEDTQLVGLELKHVLPSLLRDLAKHLAKSDLLRHEWAQIVASPGSAEAGYHLGRITHHMAIAGDTLIVLDTAQADLLASELDAASVAREHCPRCNTLIDNTLGPDLCAGCEDYR